MLKIAVGVFGLACVGGVGFVGYFFAGAIYTALGTAAAVAGEFIAANATWALGAFLALLTR